MSAESVPYTQISGPQRPVLLTLCCLDAPFPPPMETEEGRWVMSEAVPRVRGSGRRRRPHSHLPHHDKWQTHT